MPIGKNIHDVFSKKHRAHKRRQQSVAFLSSTQNTAAPPVVDPFDNIPIVAKPRNLVTLQERRHIAPNEGAPIVAGLTTEETAAKCVRSAVKIEPPEKPIDFNVTLQKPKNKGGRPKKDKPKTAEEAV